MRTIPIEIKKISWYGELVDVYANVWRETWLNVDLVWAFEKHRVNVALPCV